MEDGSRITRFEDLRVWQEAQTWAVQTYLATKQFPREETYGITSQLRRAASSISANIAETLSYLERSQLDALLQQGTSAQKLLNAYTKPLK